MATSAELLVVIKAQDQASKVLQSMGASLKGLGDAASVPIKAVQGLTGALGQIGLAAAGVDALTGAAKSLGGAMGVGLASQMEQVTARFNAFTKDGAQTEKILAQVREEANKTPFAFAEMANAAAMLLPASKSAQGGLMGLIREAEILAALNPAEGLEGAAFALREALSGDFVSVMERFNIPRELINRLKNEGVPNAQIVGRALKEMGADFSLVGNLANTTEGRLSTFQDAIDGLRLIAGRPILDALGRGLDRLSAALDQNQEPLRRVAQMIGDLLSRAVDLGVDALFGLIRVLDRVGPVFDAFGRAALAAVHGDFENAMAGIREGAELAGSILQDVLGQAIAEVQDAMADFAPTGERLGALFGFIGERVEDALPPVTEFIGGVLDATEAAGGAEGALQAVADVVNDVSAAVEDGIRAFQSSAQAQAALAAVAGALGAALAVQAVQWVAATGAMVATRVAAVAMTAAQTALNVVLAANPIGIVVVALGALAGALIYAYNTNEDFRNSVNAAWAAISAAAGVLVSAVAGRLNELSGFIQSLGPRLQADALAVGAEIVSGFVNGMNPARVVAAGFALGRAALDAARRAIDSGSPSREFMEVGAEVVEGFVVGVEGAASEAEAAVGAVMESVAEAAADPFAGLAEVLGAQFERTFSVVEKAQFDIENARDEIIRKADRDRELAERRHQRRLADLQEELGQASAKARQGVLEQIEKAHEDHARKVEDIETGMHDRLEELAFDSAGRIAEATERQALARGEALRDLQRDTEELFREVEGKMGDIRRKADEARTAARDDAAEQLEAVGERALVQIQELLGRRDLDRGIRARRDAFDERQDEAQREFREQRDAADREYKLEQDLAEAKEKLDRDLRRAEDDEDRDRLRQRYNDEVDSLRRRYDQAVKDAERRKRLEAEERAFRQRQEQERVRFQDTLEDEAIARQIARIQEERDERVRGITEALEEKLRRITENEAEERAELARSADQKLRDLKQRFYDKVGPLTGEAADAFEALFRSLAEQVGGATKAVVGLAEALARVSGARVPVPGGDGATWDNQTPEVRAMFEAAHGANARQAWEAEHNRELARAMGIDVPLPTGYDPTSGLPTGPGYFEPVPDDPYWQANWDRFNPLPYGTEYPPQAFYGSDSESRDVFGGNNDYSENQYATGGVVSGPYGAPQRAIVHGGEAVFTPDQLAALGRYAGGGYGDGGGDAAYWAHSHDIVLDGRVIGRAVEPYVSGAQGRAARVQTS